MFILAHPFTFYVPKIENRDHHPPTGLRHFWSKAFSKLLSTCPGLAVVCKGVEKNMKKGDFSPLFFGCFCQMVLGVMTGNMFFPKASPMLGFSFSLLEGGWSED